MHAVLYLLLILSRVLLHKKVWPYPEKLGTNCRVDASLWWGGCPGNNTKVGSLKEAGIVLNFPVSLLWWKVPQPPLIGIWLKSLEELWRRLSSDLINSHNPQYTTTSLLYFSIGISLLTQCPGSFSKDLKKWLVSMENLIRTNGVKYGVLWLTLSLETHQSGWVPHGWSIMLWWVEMTNTKAAILLYICLVLYSSQHFLKKNVLRPNLYTLKFTL